MAKKFDFTGKVKNAKLYHFLKKMTFCLTFFLTENEVELSSDDEVGDYENHGKSYDAYYSRVRKEMEGDSDSDDLANTYLDQL